MNKIESTENLPDIASNMYYSHDNNDVDARIVKWLDSLNSKNGEEFVSAVKAIFEELQPKDFIEAMIISKMVALHDLSLKLMSNTGRFLSPERMAPLAKLINASTKLNEDWRKHRTDATQCTQVNQVNIASGANAIVGTVNVEGNKLAT